MSCILGDGGFISRRKEIADHLGMSLPPLLTEFCEACTQWHTLQVPEDQCDMRFRMTPADVPAQVEPEKYFPKSYCKVCHAYHNRDGRCGGSREAEDWEKKEINI